MVQKVWTLASGQEVVDRDVSHIHAGVTDELLSEALSSLSVGDGERVKYTHFFRRTVGVSHCVKTQDGEAPKRHGQAVICLFVDKINGCGS
ncbi:MAG: hypothetical protein ABIB04_03865 [Patescibacteria group bacterium]